MSTDYLIERTLREKNKAYHSLISNTSFTLLYILEKYKNYFPDYTDHTIAHSLNVIDFCNRLIGENGIDKLNEDELYVLYMSAYLHDVGMGVSKQDLDEFKEKPTIKKYLDENSDCSIEELIRKFHHELSAEFIYKYKNLFEIPSELHVFSIAAVSRGHRVSDLLDHTQYPVGLRLQNGNLINVLYLATLVRLADEMDIASDRIFSFDYQEADTVFKKAHRAIRKLEITEKEFIYHVNYENDEETKEEVLKTIDKVRETLSICQRVLRQRASFRITQERVIIKEVND